MTHKLGVYWSPAHDPAPELHYIHRLQPLVIRILTEDVMPIVQAHEAAPEAVIIPRVWRLDDGRTEHNPGGVYTEINEGPYGAGVRHATHILLRVDDWRREAHERDLPFPHQDQICVAGANEPNCSCDYHVIAEYAKGFAKQCMMLNHRRVALLLLGHGHPATPPPHLIDWSAFMDLQPLLDANPDFWIETHAYWFPKGPDHDDDYAWHAGRHHSCPLRAPHLIGECGVDGTINNVNPRWGWINYGLTSYTYAQQLKTNHDRLADNVVAMLPFALGSQSKDWNGFDITKATNEILQVEWKGDKPVEKKQGVVTARVLNVRDGPGIAYEVVDRLAYGDRVEIRTTQSVSGTDWHEIEEERWVSGAWIRLCDPAVPEPPEVGPGPTSTSGFDEAMKFVFRWEGGYSDHPDDPGRATKYGISQNSYPHLDIENLTKQQAKDIYRRDYWNAMRCDEYRWPMQLVLFDTAILHGKGAARKWITKFGDSIYAFLGRRFYFYVNSKNADHFGAGWINRLKDLARMCYRAQR